MQRRVFLKSAMAGAALAAIPRATWACTQPGAAPLAAAPLAGLARAETFRMHYAPHLGMFRNLAGDDPLDQLRFMADEGFTAFEDNGMPGRDVKLQEAMGKEMEKLGLRMGVFVANSNGFGKPSFASGNADERARFLSDLENSVEVAKRVNAKWTTVVLGEKDKRLQPDYQTANVIETLRRGAEICEPAGLVMVLEPLNPWRDHPNMFLVETPQAYMICRAVNSPSCKILFDIYHQQIAEGNLIPNIDRAWDEIAYFQVGDNPGRKEPTTGEINYKNVFRHLHRKGFTGIIGMEHGNSIKGAEGERAVIAAYRACDAF
jgi:hydroxypyruvate isomerase